jgi:hypothetical protein
MKLEIGTSDFRYDKDAILIEPVRYYFDRLPADCKKFNVAVSDYNGIIDLYYLTDEEIVKYNLPRWVRGCNSTGRPHPTVVNLLKEKGLSPDIIRHDIVDVVTPTNLLKLIGNPRITDLKIDTEGNDCTILNAWLHETIRLPQRIQFENNVLSDPEEVADLVDRLTCLGYKCHQAKFDIICTLQSDI